MLKFLMSIFDNLGCVCHVIICIFLSIVYVGSFYIWPNRLPRNHPTTIKQRFLSVFVMSFISAFVVYIFADRSYFKDNSDFWSIIGVRLSGLGAAIILPLLLTMVLFLGPICLHYNDGMYNKFFDLKSWSYCMTDVMWLRSHVVAPLSEEFTFRACFISILVPCFKNNELIFYCPLIFGIAHLHLIYEKVSSGVNLQVAILSSFLQLAYTTIFGAYSTYLFLRTGHLCAPIAAHMFCNHMGFPDFPHLLELPQPKRTTITICFAAGLLLWGLLLAPCTEPHLFHNAAYLQHAVV